MPSIGRVVLPFGTQGSKSKNKESMESDCKPTVEMTEADADSSDNEAIEPTPELISKIVTQVEYYFSDENLIKDEFILKHIRRNKDGFISLKLLSSFRKVKVITKNCKLVAHCVKIGSKKLELNDTETKIRRKTPLPTLEGDKHSRTVIAYNFAVGTDNIESITKEFSKFGDIALIRLLKNNSTTSSSVIPINQLKLIENKVNLEKTTVATIEYINKSSAEEAFKRKSNNNNWRNGIEVMPLKPMMANKKQIKTGDQLETGENVIRKTYKSNETQNYYNNAYKRPLFQRQKSKSYSAADEKMVFENVFKSPFHKNNVTKVEATNGLKLPSNVLRMPRGPDGTNGFNTNRSHRSHSEP